MRAQPLQLARGVWPDEQIEDPVAEVARRFAVNLRSALGARSVRSVAAAAGLSHVTVLNVLAGRVWPDLATIVRLEQSLNTPLWPTHPLS